MTHHADLNTSARLQNMLAVLMDGEEHSTFELMERCKSCSVHTDIFELRKNGVKIKRRYAGKNANGRQINYYRLVKDGEE